MRAIFSALKTGAKKHRLLCLVVLTAVVALLAGAMIGICFERNIGVSLSDRLTRRIGTANATVVSCSKAGSALSLTVDFKNMEPEKEQKTNTPLVKQTSPEQVWNLASYGMALEGIREELTTGPFASGINSVTIICQHQGKTITTLTGNRTPKNANVSVDKSGKRITPKPFSSFEEHNADGSTEGIFAIGSDSSR